MRPRYIAIGFSRHWLPMQLDWRGWRWIIRPSERGALYLLRWDTSAGEQPEAWRLWRLTPFLRRAPPTSVEGQSPVSGGEAP